jgi:hypothetical protein
MELQAQVNGYLSAIDPERRLTYAAYAEDMINRGQKPITRSQWDVLVDVLGNRQMTDTVTERQWLENIRTATTKLS